MEGRDSAAMQASLKHEEKEKAQSVVRQLFTLVAVGGQCHDVEFTWILQTGVTQTFAEFVGMGTEITPGQNLAETLEFTAKQRGRHSHAVIKVLKSEDGVERAMWCGGWLPATNWHKDVIEQKAKERYPAITGSFDEALKHPSIDFGITTPDVIKLAEGNGQNVDVFKSWVHGLSAEELCGQQSAIDAVREILEHEFSFEAEREWDRLVYEDRDVDKFGLDVDIDPQQTRSPFANVLQTRIGRGIYEAEPLTEEEVLQEIRDLVLDWHDLFAEAFPWLGKLFCKLAHSVTPENLHETGRWLDGQSSAKLVFSEEKNNYVEGDQHERVMLREQVRRFVLTMYIYEKMSLRSLLDPHFLASLHRYYEGGLAERQKDLTRKQKMARDSMLAKGTFGSLFMQLKQASVSVTFPGLSAMKTKKEVAPQTAAGLLGILSVNIFEAVMGELLIQGRLGNGACGVALIGTESQKDVNYVTSLDKTPHLAKDATFHDAVLFGQGECPKDLESTPVCPTHIPLDRDYLNAYTSWNALFTTTMSDNHIVFAKLLYPRMLRAMIHNPGQWGDQRPWTLYMAVSGFWLRTEKHKDFTCAVDFFAATKGRRTEILQQSAEHKIHKIANRTGVSQVGGYIAAGVDKVKSALPSSPSVPVCPELPVSQNPADAHALDVSFEELDDLLPSPQFVAMSGMEWSNDMGSGIEEENEILRNLTSFLEEPTSDGDDSSGDDRTMLNKVQDGLNKVQDGLKYIAAKPIDVFTRGRVVASLYKPMLPEYPAIIQFWTEMNHRYGDLLMEQKERYNFSPQFQRLYKNISTECRQGECIDRELPHAPIPKANHPAPRAAVQLSKATFIFKEIMKTGGRTHDYLAEFYQEHNGEKLVPTEMAKQMHSSIYPFSDQMDMAALIARTEVWRDRYELPKQTTGDAHDA